jgi:beta-1,4-mannosyl-glycoprotein beta-1,4-N-acetylglucosaminyltransferase
MIYYLFQFWDELDLLEIQLNENYEYVDKFVITESTHSWTGKRKPLYFKNNMNRYSKFLEKIEHIIIDDLDSVAEFPDDVILNNFGEEHSKSYWAREYYARNKFFINNKLNPDDLIFLTDADTIINMDKAITEFEEDKINVYQMYECFYYFDNCGGKNYSSKSFKFGNFEEILKCWNQHYPDRILKHSSEKYKYVQDSAWHFSWMGGLEHSLLKLEYTSHSENNSNDYRDKLIQLYEENKFQLCDYNTFDYPRYLKDNLKKYSKYFLQDIKI